MGVKLRVECQNGGTCVSDFSAFNFECDGTGYSGDTCSQNIDECLTNPCQHGSRCNDTLGSFTCLCSGPAEGFCGQRCHVEDPCKNVPPCMNEGVCARL